MIISEMVLLAILFSSLIFVSFSISASPSLTTAVTLLTISLILLACSISLSMIFPNNTAFEVPISVLWACSEAPLAISSTVLETSSIALNDSCDDAVISCEVAASCSDESPILLIILLKLSLMLCSDFDKSPSSSFLF